MFTFDATIKLGDVMTVLGIVGGGFTFLFAMKGEIKLLTREIALQSKTLEVHSERIGKVEAVLVKQAQQDTRIQMVEKHVDELRHGEGFVRGSRGVDREY